MNRIGWKCRRCGGTRMTYSLNWIGDKHAIICNKCEAIEEVDRL